MIKSSPVEFTTSKEVRNAIPSGFTTLNVRRQVRQNKGSRMNPTTRSKRFWREGRMLVGLTHELSHAGLAALAVMTG
jgi:hypothetical protein